MKFSLVVLLAAFSLPAYAMSETGVGLSQTAEGRKASLLGGAELAATYMPSVAPALRLLDGLRFERAGAPPALDIGGGVSTSERQILGLVLGLFIGFGLGHLVAQVDGFVLWLVIDLVLVTVLSAGWWGFTPLWYLGGLALTVSHIIQGLDAYMKAGGQRLIQLNRERAIRVASAGSGLDQPADTTRALVFAF